MHLASWSVPNVPMWQFTCKWAEGWCLVKKTIYKSMSLEQRARAFFTPPAPAPAPPPPPAQQSPPVSFYQGAAWSGIINLVENKIPSQGRRVQHLENDAPSRVPPSLQGLRLWNPLPRLPYSLYSVSISISIFGRISFFFLFSFLFSFIFLHSIVSFSILSSIEKTCITSKLQGWGVTRTLSLISNSLRFKADLSGTSAWHCSASYSVLNWPGSIKQCCFTMTWLGKHNKPFQRIPPSIHL